MQPRSSQETSPDLGPVSHGHGSLTRLTTTGHGQHGNTELQMPPRHTYWTIILEGKPTAFRAHTPDELLPTLRQLQSKHPDAVLMWFARGRLWKSEEESRAALRQEPSAGRSPRPGVAPRRVARGSARALQNPARREAAPLPRETLRQRRPRRPGGARHRRTHGRAATGARCSEPETSRAPGARRSTAATPE